MAVQRTRARTETHDLGTLRLFRDDMEDIAKAVSELGALTIACDQGTYTATGPDDFSDLPEHPEELIFKAEEQGRRIEVELSQKVSRVVLTEPDTLCEGILGRIRAVVSRPGRRRRRWPSPRLVATNLLGGAVLVATAMLTGLFGWDKNDRLVPLGTNLNVVNGWVIVMEFLIITAIAIRVGEFSPHLILVNEYRTERPSFWRRTRDDWMVQIIGGALFLVLGFVLGKITSSGS